MKRDIKFRGVVDNTRNDWETGFLVIDPQGRYRIYKQPFLEATSNTYYFVKPDSVGQYTGLKDKHGTEVYEGDIVRCSRGCPHEVVFIQEHGGTFFGGMPTFYLSGLNEGYSWSRDEEVIGNIYETPELLTLQS